MRKIDRVKVKLNARIAELDALIDDFRTWNNAEHIVSALRHKRTAYYAAVKCLNE
ncbi:Uncharacterised protein [uncultured archaeon]|nr:Uncharacterised protein [uncultured archaeon]